MNKREIPHTMKLRSRRGSVLVVSLVVVAGLVAIVASIAASQQAAINEQIHREERVRAVRAADSAVQRAFATLALILAPGQSGTTSATTTPASSTSTSGATTLQDDWATLGQNGDEHFLVRDASFRMQIIDASSLVNINTALTPQLELLPFNTDEVAAIVDYRTTGNTPSANGAKDEYYTNLQQPYSAKEASFETVDELLQVRGLTAKILYEPRTDVQSTNPAPVDANGNQLPLASVLTAVSLSPQVTPTGGTKISVARGSNVNANRLVGLGISRNVANLIAPTPNNTNWTTLGQLCRLPGVTNADLKAILDNLAVNTQTQVSGRININTASQSVLLTLPGMTADVASSIVSQQSQGFTSAGDITSVSGVNGNLLAQIADSITATSQTFIIRVIGTAGSTSIPFEAIVNVVNGVPKLVQMQEQPFNDMVTRWNWQASTTTDTVLKDNS